MDLMSSEKNMETYLSSVLSILWRLQKNGFVNAVSVATTILSTNAIVTHARVGKN